VKLYPETYTQNSYHTLLYDILERTKCMGYRFSWDFSKSSNVLKTIYYTINTPKKTTLKAKKQPPKQPSNPVDFPQITIDPETYTQNSYHTLLYYWLLNN
jgi:hypothetical protein